jgi:hypothetical protein
MIEKEVKRRLSSSSDPDFDPKEENNTKSPTKNKKRKKSYSFDDVPLLEGQKRPELDSPINRIVQDFERRFVVDPVACGSSKKDESEVISGVNESKTDEVKEKKRKTGQPRKIERAESSSIKKEETPSNGNEFLKRTSIEDIATAIILANMNKRMC